MKTKSKLQERRRLLARARWGAYPTRSAHGSALLRIICDGTTRAQQRPLMAACLTLLGPEDGQYIKADLPPGTPMADGQWDAIRQKIGPHTSAFIDGVKVTNLPVTRVAQGMLDFLASLASDPERAFALASMIEPESGLAPYAQIPAQFLRSAFPPNARAFGRVRCRRRVQHSINIIQRIFRLQGARAAQLFSVLRAVLAQHADPVEREVLISVFFKETQCRRHGASMFGEERGPLAMLLDLVTRGGATPPESPGAKLDAALQAQIAHIASAYRVDPAIVRMALEHGARQAGLSLQQAVDLVFRGDCQDQSCPLHGRRKETRRVN